MADKNSQLPRSHLLTGNMAKGRTKSTTKPATNHRGTKHCNHACTTACKLTACGNTQHQATLATAVYTNCPLDKRPNVWQGCTTDLRLRQPASNKNGGPPIHKGVANLKKPHVTSSHKRKGRSGPCPFLSHRYLSPTEWPGASSIYPLPASPDWTHRHKPSSTMILMLMP